MKVSFLSVDWVAVILKLVALCSRDQARAYPKLRLMIHTRALQRSFQGFPIALSLARTL